jgi:arylsulfatase A-like enzyme/cytochrome c-type biogenesis protein CcmH/NrfG
MCSRKLRLALLVSFFFGLWPGLIAARTASPPAKDANVLLITIDTLRADRVGIYSDKYVKTPNIDALAGRSIVFTHAYAQSTLTRPSHTNIMTGMTPLYHGVSDNPGFKLEARYLTLAEHLKEAGYRTAAFVGCAVLDSRFGLNQGFDLYYDSGMGIQEPGPFDIVQRTADQVVKPAGIWIADQSEKWFCWVHLFDPHAPYVPPSPFKEQYASDPYSGEVAFVDAQLGFFFDDLEKKGKLEKTVIIITADHGEAFGEKDETYHGFFAYDNTIHIPLILSYPGDAPGRIDENVCHTDIFPTVCDLVGRPIPSHIQGESLVPIAAGRPRRNPAIYFESMSPHLNLDAAPLGGLILGAKKFIDQPIKEVYDLASDPGEERNIASTSDLPKFSAQLEAERKELKGRGTKQDIKGTTGDVRKFMESLSYIAGRPERKGSYGIGDDLKTLWPLVQQMHTAVDDLKVGRTDLGMKKLASILRIRPTYVSAYSLLSDAYFNLGRTDQALDMIRTGLGKNPESLPLMGKLGQVLIKTKDYPGAIEALSFCVEKDPNDPDNLNLLGRAYMETQKFDLARDYLERAVEADPKLAAAHNNLGYLDLVLFVQTSEEKYREDAIAEFDKALAIDPRLQSAIKGKETALSRRSETGTV